MIGNKWKGGGEVVTIMGRNDHVICEYPLTGRGGLEGCLKR